MLEPVLGRWVTAYRQEVGAQLASYGLRADDLLDPDADKVQTPEQISSHRSLLVSAYMSERGKQGAIANEVLPDDAMLYYLDHALAYT